MSLASNVLLFSLIVSVVQLSRSEEKPSYWYHHDYPNPRTEQERCGRESTKPSWLCDPDKLLTNAEATKVDKLIANVRTKTKCQCYKCINKNRGYLIMVALMDKMYRNEGKKNDSQEHLFSDSKKFSKKLMRRWGGKSMCNEFVIILYSKADNVLFTFAEANAEKLLNTSMRQKVQNHVKWYFGSEQNVGKGLIMMIQDYWKIFMKKYKERPKEDLMKVKPEPAGQIITEAAKEEPKNSANQNNFKQFVPFILLLLVFW